MTGEGVVSKGRRPTAHYGIADLRVRQRPKMRSSLRVKTL
jgi:hypothetical protein